MAEATPPPEAARYRVLPAPAYDRGDYTLRALAFDDREPIRRWRNAQLAVLRQASPISAEAQERYFRDVVAATYAAEQPSQILLALLHRGALIGYGGLVHIAWHDRRAEVSFLLDPARLRDAAAYRAEFAAFLAIISHIAFEVLGLRRLTTETFDVRPDHIQALEGHGFVCEGRMRGHVLLDGAPVDSLIHGLLREDPHAR